MKLERKWPREKIAGGCSYDSQPRHSLPPIRGREAPPRVEDGVVGLGPGICPLLSLVWATDEAFLG